MLMRSRHVCLMTQCYRCHTFVIRIASTLNKMENKMDKKENAYKFHPPIYTYIIYIVNSVRLPHLYGT